MPNLKKLKERLEKFPQLKSERNLSATFGIYSQKIAKNREVLSDSYRDMEYITKIFPDAECKNNVEPLLKKSVKEAKKIYQSIEEDPQAVQKKSTDNSVVKIGENAKSASTKCREIWKREITNNVSKWENLATLIQNLGAKGGQEFKKAVDSLKNQKIPQTDDEVTIIKNIQKELRKVVANLSLEGPFGKFLETAATERGASPQDLFRPEIKEKIEDFNLWDSFKVQLKK